MTGTNFGDLAKKIRGGESATAQEMKNTPPEIIVTRRRNRTGGTELVAGKYARRVFAVLNDHLITISVNGHIVASLTDDETIKVFGVPGENVVGAGFDDNVHTEVRFFLENGMKKRLFCGMTAGSIRLRET